MINMKKTSQLLAVLGAISVATSASAARMSLEDINNGGGTFVSGDKILSDFSFTANSAGGALVASESTIFLTDVIDGGTGDVGVEFDVTQGLTAFSGQSANIQITFKVSVAPAQLAQGWVIDGVSLAMSGGGNTGDGGAFIAEGVYATASTNGPTLASLNTSSSGTSVVSYDSQDVAESDFIYVRKDISVTGGNVGAGHISEFFQYYSQSQSTGNVPEPASLMLLAVGGVAMIKRRK